MSKKTLIKLKNLNKTFNIHKNRAFTLRQVFASCFDSSSSTEKFHALKDINLTVEEGDFIGIIGRNGSGKSTLLKLIAGIYSQDKGSEIVVEGRIVPFLELGVGFNIELTGRENIYLNGTILGMTKEYLDSILDEIIDFAELRKFIDEPVKNYSSGMLVRLAFSIAIRSDADIYILDEILAVGDELFQQKSKGVIKELIEKGKTILYVSHSIESIKEYCNKVLWLEKGEMRFYGDTLTGAQLYQQSLLQKEKRDNKKENERVDKVGSMEVEIKKVDVKVLSSEEIIIKLELSYRREKLPVNVNFGIFNSFGHAITAFRSTDEKVKIARGAESVTVSLKNLNLNGGKYYLNVGVYNQNEKDPYHWQRNAAVFRIELDEKEKAKKYRGIVHFQTEWKID